MVRIIFFIALLILGYLGYFWYQDTYASPNSGKEFVILTLNTQEVKAEVVRSYTDKRKGLSFRDSLAPRTGMLFVFNDMQYPQIWMKDMRFAIDILFIDKEGRIVQIFESATPESYFETPPRMFRSLEASRYVLELPAGTVEDEGISTGMVIPELK